MSTHYGLIADIGGTNARFALAPIKLKKPSQGFTLSEEELIHSKTLDGENYDNIHGAVTDYLSGLPESIDRPTHGVLAIACPTDQDQITMTNHTWSFKVSELKTFLGFETLIFINDYHALANSLPHLGSTGALQIGEGTPEKGSPMLVTGPGTGLGAGGLAFDKHNSPITLPGEGGHMHFAATNDDEIQILKFLLTKYERVSAERLLSGMGLENIYQAYCHIDGVQFNELSAPEVTRHAVDSTNEQCKKAFTTFCSVLGSFAGDAAMLSGAKGGVFIAGGILPRFIDFFQSSEFRKRFEDKGRMRSFVENIPTYLIVSSQPGLIGSAAVLNHEVGSKLN